MRNDPVFGSRLKTVAASMLCVLTVACAGDAAAPAVRTTAADAPSPDTAQACDEWRQIVELLAADPDQEPPEVQRTWEALLPLLASLQETSSAERAADVDRFAGALRRYAAHLETIDYDLETLFETRRGKKVAVATSHALTPVMVERLEEDCQISFG